MSNQQRVSDAVADGILLRIARMGYASVDDLNRLVDYINSLRNSKPRPKQ